MLQRPDGLDVLPVVAACAISVNVGVRREAEPNRVFCQFIANANGPHAQCWKVRFSILDLNREATFCLRISSRLINIPLRCRSGIIPPVDALRSKNRYL
jgi:hypothetical protein